MANIQRIINKDNWSGKELGQLELTDMAVAYAASKMNEARNVIDPETLQQMVNTLATNQRQLDIYNNYIAVHNWLAAKDTSLKAFYYNGITDYDILHKYISEAIIAEEARNYINTAPVIMEQKEYDSMLETKKAELLGDNKASILEIVLYSIGFLASNNKKPMKAILESYKKEPITSEVFLKQWEFIFPGYIEIKSKGKKKIIDSRDPKFNETIKAASMKLREINQEADKHHSYANRAITQFLEMIPMRVINNATSMLDNKSFLDSSIKHTDTAKKLLSDYTEIEFKKYKAPPKEITKADFIAIRLTPLAEKKNNSIDFTAADYIGEFPEAVAIAEKDIKAKYGIDVFEAPIEEWENKYISYNELYDLGFYDFKGSIDKQILSKYENGIAVYKHREDVAARRPTYEIENALLNNAFLDDNGDYNDIAKQINEIREDLINMYYYILGYNKQIQLLSSFCAVPEIKFFELDLNFLYSKISRLNSAIHTLKKKISNSYKDKDKELKLQILEDLYQPIEIDKIDIPEENIAQANELLKKFKAFDSKDNILMFDKLLCWRNYKPEELNK